MVWCQKMHGSGAGLAGDLEETEHWTRVLRDSSGAGANGIGTPCRGTERMADTRQ